MIMFVAFSRFPAVLSVAPFHHAAICVHRYGNNEFAPLFHGELVFTGFNHSAGSTTSSDAVPACTTSSSYCRPRVVDHPRQAGLFPAAVAGSNCTPEFPGMFGGPCVKSAVMDISG
ncbi:hypothetical protein H480_19343 [Amycolatopsis vancoresmycina DSM 44592]|uniref:Secreted protein n=1 Tax=Amycolatopsis vancoresmycina DSM 44592 TaxID=1292037 RepID=R1HTP7_9PSEU|nr:hypothetical protein H480_19343 [Amycolatopsis vancoresmycina DSM 44592]